MSITKIDFNNGEFKDRYLDENGEIFISESEYKKWFIGLFQEEKIEYPIKTKNKKLLDKFGNETQYDELKLYSYVRDATNLHNWYDILYEHTFKTVFYDFSDDEIKELKDLRFDVDYKGSVHENLKKFMNSDLIKYMKEESNKDVNEYFVKFTSTSTHLKKFYTKDDVDSLLIDLVKNDRTWLEIERGINVLCFREYHKADYERNEFRCFIYNKKLNAISQYITYCYYNHDKNKVINLIHKFIKKIKIPYDDCTVDILLENDECKIIEINSFGDDMGCGSCCFNWYIDHNILYGKFSEQPIIRIAADIKYNNEYLL